MGRAAFIVLCAQLVGAAPADPIAAASAALGRGDPARAAALLEEALRADPGNEALYRELSDVYDQHAHSYEKARALHASYLRSFPGGRFRSVLAERQATLERHRAVWPLLRSYRQVLAAGHQRTAAANVALVEGLLSKAAGTSLEPELLRWLAAERAERDGRRALEDLDRCVTALVAQRRPAKEICDALSFRAHILTEQRRYGAALEAVRRANALIPGAGGEERPLLRMLWSQWGFYAATCLFGGLLLLGLGARGWRAQRFTWSGRQLLAWAFGLALVTLLPMAAMRQRFPRTQLTFLAMAGFAVVGLVGLKLLSPLAARWGRAVYLGLALVLTCAGLYMAFYLGDSLESLEWPFEALRRGR